MYVPLVTAVPVSVSVPVFCKVPFIVISGTAVPFATVSVIPVGIVICPPASTVKSSIDKFAATVIV